MHNNEINGNLLYSTLLVEKWAKVKNKSYWAKFENKVYVEVGGCKMEKIRKFKNSLIFYVDYIHNKIKKNLIYVID